MRVVLRGALAELAYPYLRSGSKVAVDGHLQTRERETGKRVVEMTAEHIAFLEDIDWEAGEAAQRAKEAISGS
jgi:single-stranded DNA-binding protein